jgi:uncharacterized protein with GYD domain
MDSRNTIPNFLSGAALGAAVMFILDPIRGHRRRAMLKDKAFHALHETQGALDVASRDLVHRAQGFVAEARHLFDSMPVDDDVLVARVRSRMGRVVSHPGMIEVSARNGQVTLRGQIPEAELDALLRIAGSVRGVSGVINRLDAREAMESQSQKRRAPILGARTPAGRLVAVLAGGGTIGSALLARGVFGKIRQLLERSSFARDLMSPNVIPISRPALSAGPDLRHPRTGWGIMATYILLTRMTTEAMQDLEAFREHNSHVDERLGEEGVDVSWLAHYTVLGPYDYLDIFEARDNEEAAKVALIIRSLGHATTEVWPAVPWERFEGLGGAHGGSKNRVRKLKRKGEEAAWYGEAPR